jgi:uronate dehydrogenase
MFKKLVLTGARGALGTSLREPLSRLCETLLTTDILEAPATLLPNEIYRQADVSRMDEIAPLLKGADMAIHFGAIVDEKPFEELWGPNFVGAYNVWEAAYKHGVKRVVYASSIHAVGMYSTNVGIDTEVPHRPDTFYGLAKCFAEDLGRMYWEKRGIESVHLRILSCTPEPQNTRALGTWLSHADMIQLVERAIDTPIVGFTVIYGVSNNTRAPVSNARVPFLGYRPQDNAEYRANELFAKAPPADPQDLGLTRVGGPFAKIPLGESGIAALKMMSGVKADPASKPVAKAKAKSKSEVAAKPAKARTGRTKGK